jgi:hypothetical protein
MPSWGRSSKFYCGAGRFEGTFGWMTRRLVRSHEIRCDVYEDIATTFVINYIHKHQSVRLFPAGLNLK